MLTLKYSILTLRGAGTSVPRMTKSIKPMKMNERGAENDRGLDVAVLRALYS